MKKYLKFVDAFITLLLVYVAVMGLLDGIKSIGRFKGVLVIDDALKAVLMGAIIRTAFYSIVMTLLILFGVFNFWKNKKFYLHQTLIALFYINTNFYMVFYMFSIDVDAYLISSIISFIALFYFSGRFIQNGFKE